MDDTSRNKPKKQVSIGLLAHVDAGKTTLAESILYLRGQIRTMGRVDHKNAFLDTYELERERGITIFSKQANVWIGETQVALLDTPGHVDFSAEMERTFQVLDYAVLVINGADGVQAHVETLWELLKRYGIPTFLFINKMDQERTDKKRLLEELKEKQDVRCVDFSEDITSEQMQEALAECDEELLEQYLEGRTIEAEGVRNSIANRTIFPCYFGSALKLSGVEALLDGIECYTKILEYPKEFGARVYKIGRDERGIRLTYMKITGGTIKVKMLLKEQKVNQIRIYTGASFEMVPEAEAGSICAVAGLEHTYAGEVFGMEDKAKPPLLEPVLTYQILLPKECDVYQTFLKLRTLEEEEPQMQLVWKESLLEIHVKLMGEVQKEVLKRLISERFELEVEFGQSSIVYKETIAETVEGVGHFEPLRHYAEVHLLLEPLERGQGLVFDTICSEDVLDKNWQRLILTHLEEQPHPGVLTGSEITDMKITLLIGKAHQKHTEGGDFRQAVYRAVRHGLKRATSLLLEPIYQFSITVPQEMAGRVLSDIQKMQGTFDQPEISEEMSVVKGTAPIAVMQGYQTELLSYTKGRGRMSIQLKGYEVCHNQEEVVSLAGYDSERDLEHATGSVFCQQGAGFSVPWNEVESYMHLPYQYKAMEERQKEGQKKETARTVSEEMYDEKELQEIFQQTYGRIERKKSGWEKAPQRIHAQKSEYKPKTSHMVSKEQYLLVDGYNIIFAWEELKEVAKVNIEGARNKLLDIMCNYQGYKKSHVIVVFDAYKVPGNLGSTLKYHNIHVVYTKEAETADQYIEKTVPHIVEKYRVTVATSDALEQMIIMGQGAERLSARGLQEEIESVNQEMREQYLDQTGTVKQSLTEYLPR